MASSVLHSCVNILISLSYHHVGSPESKGSEKVQIRESSMRGSKQGRRVRQTGEKAAQIHRITEIEREAQ